MKNGLSLNIYPVPFTKEIRVMGATVDIKDHTANVMKDVKQAALAALEEIGLEAEKHAQRFLEGDGAHPKRIDTGNLRNSIVHEVAENEDAVYIGTNVDYAPYVHYGTTRMLPNAFLRDAASNYMNEYKAIVEEHMNALK